jgi:cytochrome oxidase Cu insertion factor (SCO1/SenC/PrrC family)
MRKTAINLFLAVSLAASAMAQTPTAAPAKSAAPPKQEAPTPTVKVGDMAPDFTLLDQNRQPVQLSSFRGKKSVVVAFIVFAFTGG